MIRIWTEDKDLEMVYGILVAVILGVISLIIARRRSVKLDKMDNTEKEAELERLKQKEEENAEYIAKSNKAERIMYAVIIGGVALVILYSFVFVS